MSNQDRNAQQPDDRPSSSKLVYPDLLAAKEDALINKRRKIHDPTGPDSREMARESVCLAFSGGGIRSATFCLGVLQHLARKGWLKHFDLLSTVSGGGYAGSFLGKLIQEKGSVAGAEQILSDNQSWTVRWLRENGYYLAPGGSADSWVILALLLRNWVAIHITLAGTLIIPFLCGAIVRRLLWEHKTWNKWECDWFSNFSSGHIGLSPWFLLVALAALFGLLIPGIVYWFTQFLPTKNDDRDRAQSSLTHWTGFGLLLASALTLISVMDTAGNWIYFHLTSVHGGVLPTLGLIYGGLIAGFGVLQKFAGKLTDLTKAAGKNQASLPTTALVGLGGYVWALLFWLALAIAGQWFLFRGLPIPDGPGYFAGMVQDWREPVIMVSAYTGIVLVFARVYGFVNLSSLHQYYSTRLCRAYLGASNVERERDLIPVTQPHSSDDLFWNQYEPQTFGGPLHLLNCTLNETISGKSQTEQIDRKGLSFAMGPIGLSVGGEHHAYWTKLDDKTKSDDRLISPIPNGSAFQVFPVIPASDKKNEKDKKDEKNETFTVENLRVGDWIGISGAAFSTGMGANTSTGLSLLLGFANIRLGYWWNSGINPRKREKSKQPKAQMAELLNRNFAWLLPAPSSLLDELLAQFHGPARRRWYLSDGGHFENTACYELLRRRVRFILCLDCGQDEAYAFEDIANLVRKARIDFDAEIEFIDANKAETLRATFPAPFDRLKFDLIGLPKDFHPVAPEETGCASISGPKHALLARVVYDCSAIPDGSSKQASTHILFLKPSLSGEESEDVAQYHTAHPAFPQESTSEQFFNESQWESYRALGVHIAASVLLEKEEPDSASGGGRFTEPEAQKAKSVS